MSKYNTVCKLTARWVKPHSVYVHVIHVLQELFRANYNGVRSILPCWASVCVCKARGSGTIQNRKMQFVDYMYAYDNIIVYFPYRLLD